MVFPLISIIIPVYNAAKHLAETVESAVNQTWANKEIIIVDDGSTDNSLSIAKQFEERGAKIFTQPNKGASAARNRGLKESTGEYIQFLDADDVLSSDKIESQMKQLSGHPNYLALCTTVYFKDDTDRMAYPVTHDWTAKGSDDPADFIIKLYGGALIGPEYGGMIQPNAWLTPRHVIEKAGNWNEELTYDDDGEFFCRVMLASSGIVYSQQGVNYYRKYSSGNKNLSAKKDLQNFKSALLANQLKAKHLLAARDDTQARLALSRYFWENCFNSYPKFREIARLAEKQAKKLAPGYKYNPYRYGFKQTLANLIGWKLIRYAQYLKYKS